ncbi:MAG: ester cyclase [Chloroflexi bacterium]|nr:ester cyclase [Chloroflexota bacterium]
MKRTSSSLVRRIFELAFNQGDLVVVDELLTSESITHIPTWGMPASRTGFKLFIASLRAAFPDLYCIIDGEIFESGRLAANWTMRGTHLGPFLGNPSTGRKILAKGTIFVRIADERIIEVQIQIDQYDLLQQLGIVPPSRGGA